MQPEPFSVDTSKKTTLHRAGEVKDWDGTILRKDIFKLLEVGCFVRVVTEDTSFKKKKLEEKERERLGLEKDDKEKEREKEKLADSGAGTYTMSADYLKITKIKDGTVWGEVQDTYRMQETGYPKETGETMTARFNEIIEIPISWQPKRLQKKMEAFRVPK